MAGLVITALAATTAGRQEWLLAQRLWPFMSLFMPLLLASAAL